MSDYSSLTTIEAFLIKAYHIWLDIAVLQQLLLVRVYVLITIVMCMLYSICDWICENLAVVRTMRILSSDRKLSMHY